MDVGAKQVLRAVLHGDSVLFGKHPELLNALVRVYFHSSLQKYNRTECWGAQECCRGKFIRQILYSIVSC